MCNFKILSWILKFKDISGALIFTFFSLSLSFSIYVTWSREMSHLLKMSIPFFVHHFLITPKCFILMQTPLQLYIWLQSYEEFVNAKNNINQRNLITVFGNISKTTWPTSDPFLFIMSHITSLIGGLTSSVYRLTEERLMR